MTLWSLLTSKDALPADLVRAGVVTSDAQVYPGRRPQHVTHLGLEVWLERLPRLGEGSGLQRVALCAVRFHVRKRLDQGPDQTGALQLAQVEGHLHTIYERYHGAVPLVAVPALRGSLPAVAVEGSLDVDPEDEDVLEGTVDVTFALPESSP